LAENLFKAILRDVLVEENWLRHPSSWPPDRG
jgi:hypothetical protein